MQNILNRTVSPETYPLNPELFGIDSLLPFESVFSNGITCYQLNKGTQDLVKIDFLFNAGTIYQQKTFTAFSTIQLLTEGTKNYTSVQISRTFDFYGAYIEKEIDKDFATISVYCLNKYLHIILPLTEEIIKYPLFPDNELSLFKDKQKSQLIINREKVSYVARTHFTEILYGSEHPYGKVADIYDIESIEVEDLKCFHKNSFRSENCSILVSGKIDKKCVELINSSFGSEKWGGGFNDITYVYKEPLINDEKFHYIEKENAVQSAIRMGKLMFTVEHPDFINFQILNTILGGYFGSRLMKNIREDKGYTYGIGSAIIPLKHSGFFFISSEVGKEYTIQTIDEINLEIQKLATDLVSEEELDLVRNYKSGEFLRSIDGPFAMAGLIKNLIHWNVSIDYYKKYLKTLKTINSEEILLTAKKYFTDNNMTTLIVGKK